MIDANLCHRYKRPERESGKQQPHEFINNKLVNLFNVAQFWPVTSPDKYRVNKSINNPGHTAGIITKEMGNIFMYVIGTLCYATAAGAMVLLYKAIILDEKKSKKLKK